MHQNVDGERDLLKENLDVIKESEDPLVRVIYHMGMRQLATSERLTALEGRLDRLLQAFVKTGSRPDLRAIKP